MACYKSRVLFAIGSSVGLLFTSSALFAQPFIGPTPYLSKNDSPFLTSINAGTTFLETFESGALATPGVTVSAGSVIGPGGLTDSVDADDGAIDGSGTNGHSFFSGAGSTGITFTFDANVLGTGRHRLDRRPGHDTVRSVWARRRAARPDWSGGDRRWQLCLRDCRRPLFRRN